MPFHPLEGNMDEAYWGAKEGGMCFSLVDHCPLLSALLMYPLSHEKNVGSAAEEGHSE